jgi:hypothetical protein
MYWTNSINSYAANYAFGAYLVRNFGGPELLSDMAKSPLSGRDSLNTSLRKINDDPNKDVDYALSRFGEVLVYSGKTMPNGVLSFDKTVSAIIEGNKYTFPGFNIWDMKYVYQEKMHIGPIVFRYDQAQSKTIPHHAVQLLSREEWQDVYGQLTVQVQNGNSAVRYYVMVK